MMGGELNDLPEVTGVAEWRFREQHLKRLLPNQNQGSGQTDDLGRGVRRIGDQVYEQPK